jgi:hypothetical protein
VAFKIHYVYDCINKLFGAQAEVILNHVNPTVRRNEQGEARNRKHMRPKIGDSQAYDHSGHSLELQSNYIS